MTEPRRPTRFARGSTAPRSQREWISVAVRARFPKLAAALGDAAFELMLASYLVREPVPSRALHETALRIAEFLAGSPQYPVWYGELAKLDRAHIEVLAAPRVPLLAREELRVDTRVHLVPGHALVDLTTAVDELWDALERGQPHAPPRELDYPRTVLVWRTAGFAVSDRTAHPDEVAALRAAARGTTIDELAELCGGENPSARALDLALRWIDAGVLAR